MPKPLSPAERVALARGANRPGTAEIIGALFTDFFEQQGDRYVAVLPELMHIPLGVARSRAERGNGAAFDTNFFALAGV